MKLRHKKTGEIGKVLKIADGDDEIEIMTNTGSYLYSSLAKLYAEWEDYEEGERIYYLEYTEEIKDILCDVVHPETRKKMKSIGNYFKTKEEAERVVEKLKAWKRLKDRGFKFNGWENGKTEYPDYISFSGGKYPGSKKDLDLLFGGKDE